jgi:hypothetical protein
MPIMMSEKPENRMPRSHPARAASVSPPPGGTARDAPAERFDVAFFDEVGRDWAPREVVRGAVGGPGAGSAGADGLRPRRGRAPAGFAGRRGVRAESPFITLLIAGPEDHDGGGHSATPVAVSYVITP